MRRLAALLAVVLLLLGTACSGDDDDSDDEQGAESTTTTSDDEEGTTDTTESSEVGADTTVTTTPATVALRELVLDNVLPGFTPASGDDVVTGALDLDAAARLESDVEAERSALETRHFRAGWASAWTGPDNDTVLVTLYRFASPEDADAYLEDGRENLLARTAQPFQVPGIPGAFGFTDVDDSGSSPFTAHVVAFTEGDVYALVIVGGNGSRRTPDEARQVAAAQGAALTTG